MTSQFKLIVFLVAGFFISCNGDKSNQKGIDSLSVNDGNKSNNDSGSSQITGEIGYLSFGAIQGLAENDPLKNVRLGYKESYQNPSTETFYIPKGSLEDLRAINIQEYWDLHKEDINASFHVIEFQYPFFDPATQEDYHDLNITLPCDIKSFITIDGKRKELNALRVNEWEELSAFKSREIVNGLSK